MQQTKIYLYFLKWRTTLDRLDTSDQTSGTGTLKCTDRFSLKKNVRKLKDNIWACIQDVSACGDGAVPQCQPKCSALRSNQCECLAREITRNLTLQKNKKKTKQGDKDRRTVGTHMKMFESEDFKTSTDSGWVLLLVRGSETHELPLMFGGKRIWNVSRSFLCFFWSFSCFHVPEFFLHHLFINCFFWGEQFLLNKLLCLLVSFY